VIAKTGLAESTGPDEVRGMTVPRRIRREWCYRGTREGARPSSEKNDFFSLEMACVFGEL